MNNSHTHSAFYKIFVKMTLFMARPIDFHRLEANHPNWWDDSSQGQENRPSGEAIRPSSVVSPVSPVFFSSQSDVSIFLIFEVPIWVKSNCSVSKPLMSLFIYPFLYSIFWFIFDIWYCFKYVFGIFVWFFFISLSMWLIWLYLLVRYILLP